MPLSIMLPSGPLQSAADARVSVHVMGLPPAEPGQNQFDGLPTVGLAGVEGVGAPGVEQYAPEGKSPDAP